MTEEERRLLAALRVRLGHEPEEEENRVLGAIDKATLPIRATFGTTGHTGGRALGTLFPDALEQAREEMRQSYGLDETSSALERAEALPGAGDVGAQLVPESIRESTVGRALGPAARITGNILGDPTTYTHLVLGRVAGGLAKGIPAAARAAGQLKRLEALSSARRVAGAGRAYLERRGNR